MARKHKPEDIIGKLREADIVLAYRARGSQIRPPRKTHLVRQR